MKIEWLEKHLKTAETLIYEKNVEEGLTVLTNLLYDEPGYAGLHNHLGWAYLYHAVNLTKAERHFMLALRFEPEFAPPYLHLGALYVQTARYAEAIAILKNGLTKPNANRTAILETIAEAYELKLDYRNAIATYREAMVSTVGPDVATFTEAIKRVRKKRWALMFTF